MDDALRVIIFSGIFWLLSIIYVVHPDMPKKAVDWILDDFPYRIVLFGFGGFILVVLVNMINY